MFYVSYLVFMSILFSIFYENIFIPQFQSIKPLLFVSFFTFYIYSGSIKNAVLLTVLAVFSRCFKTNHEFT